jgi:hypothetical protein
MVDPANTATGEFCGNFPLEVVELVLAHLPRADVAACTRLNKAWYLAAKPFLFTTVRLNRTFVMEGPNHDVRDRDVGERPLFRRSWMTRHCTTLVVEAHDPWFCAVAKANPLPHLRTLNVPANLHFLPNDRPAPWGCRFHALPVRHAIIHGFNCVTEEPSATSAFAPRSLESLTLLLQDTYLVPLDYNHPPCPFRPFYDATSFLSQVKRGGQVTLVPPRAWINSFGGPLHPAFLYPSPEASAEGVRAYFELTGRNPYQVWTFNGLGGVVAAGVVRDVRFRLVGWWVSNGEDEEAWVPWHVAVLAQVKWEGWKRDDLTFWAQVKAHGVTESKVEAMCFEEPDLVACSRDRWVATPEGEAALLANGAKKRWGGSSEWKSVNFSRSRR